MEPPIDDRLSDLPQPIIHHIFSFLETNEIPRITRVSTKFRDLCTSSPHLDLEADFLSRNQNCSTGCQDFTDFVNRALTQRRNADNNAGVHRLRLHWLCDQPHYRTAAGPLIDRWIEHAADCNVQELDIAVFPGDRELFVIPPCLSNCQSLRELKLNLKGRDLVLQPASFVSLVDLTLSNLNLCPTFSGGAIGQWISNCCKSLKTLCLDNVVCSVKKDLCISSSSLQQLTLRGCKFTVVYELGINCASLRHLTMSSCTFNECSNIVVTAERLKTLTVDLCFAHYSRMTGRRDKISVFAPHLSAFSWTGTPASYNDQMEHFWCLEEAIVSLAFRNYIREKEFVSDFLDRLLHSVRYTQLLQLNVEVFTHYNQPGVFDNLEHLVVIVPRFEDDVDQAVSPFISGLRNLRTLTIKLDDYDDAVVDTNVVFLICLRAERYVTKKKPRKLVLSFHEYGELDSKVMKGNAGLLKCILECEKALEKVTIFY